MSPLDPGVLQVSLIQYSLLSESELQAYYPKIENSFSGVAWKNDNTWEKRKQRLFAAMDECQADIYCFQNVQCSIAVYNKCITDAKLTEDEIIILRNINSTTSLDYRKRLNLYFGKIHDALISADDSDTDGLNCVNDIYKKYKDSYDFVYFFEQVFYTSEWLNSRTTDKTQIILSGYAANMLYPEYGKKVALGNLTMVKKSKFEIENKLRYDVRIGAAFCSENVKKKFDTNFPIFSSTSGDFKDEYDSMCRNKSFASMVYIRFKPAAEVSTPVEVTLEKNLNISQVESAMNNEETKFEEEEKEVLESNLDEDVVESDEANVSPGVQEGQEGGAPSWYDKDTTEVEGYDRVIKKPQPPVPPVPPGAPPLPCFDTKDTLYIPSYSFNNSQNQLYGICNIKFDTSDISEISQKQKPGVSNSLPKDVMQLVLMIVFIYKLRFNMQSYGLQITNLNNNPFIVSGLFRDNMITGSDNNPVLSPALRLLTTDGGVPWRRNIDTEFGKHNGPVDNFVRSMIILTYLRVGKIRVAGYYNKKFNSKLIGDFYPLEQRSVSSISELIICCDNFKICDIDPDSDKIMHKMIPARNPNPNFPLFPNKVNPSNSVAIGGVFDITTPAIKNHVEQVKASIEQQKLADETAVNNAQLASVQPYISAIDATNPTYVINNKLIASNRTQHNNNGPYINVNNFTFKPDTMIGDQTGGDIDSYIKVCTNGIAYDEYLTKSDVTKWTNTSNDIYSDHAPIRYEYTIDDKTGLVTCSTSASTTSAGTRIIRFVTWNIAYQMVYNSKNKYYTSKFYCSKATTDPCKEEDDIYKQRLTNILNAVDIIMQRDNVDYVLLQECEYQVTTSQTAIKNIANEITGFMGKYDVLNFSYNDTSTAPPAPQVQKNTEFCLIVKKPTPPTPSDIKEFNFIPDTTTNNYPTLMSQYLAEKFSSYSTTNKSALPYISINRIDINSVMCYVIPSTKTIFFNVHFKFGNLIWQRQKQIYDFMNAIVDIIRSIPSSYTTLHPYKNYDIVFSGDFNVNILQRFPQNLKYLYDKPTEPYFFKCVKVPGQKTIISTTKDNFPSAFATESNTNNYNTTNIDFSVLYPALVSAAAAPLKPTPAPTHTPTPAPASSLPLKGVVQVREGKGTWPPPNNKLADGEATKIFAPIKNVIDGILEDPLYRDYYIGLTYSANRDQTSNIFKEYGFTDSQRPSSSSTMPPKFTNVPVAKILKHISGANQANVLEDLYNKGNGELVTNLKYKNFRIIPFSTMEGGLPVVVPTTGKLGDESDSMKFVNLFLTLHKTIIIGWTSSMSTKLITSDKEKQGNISHFTDLFIAIGGGIGASNTFIGDLSKKYINLLISKWDNPSQNFVNSILGIAPIVSTLAPIVSTLAPIVSTPAPIVSTHAPSTATPFLKVMSFNTWFAAFSPKDHTNGDDTRYCNNFGINPENPCKKNIMDEIMRQIEKGTQVIFLQEFVRTDQIRNTFTGYPVSFTDTSQHPFVMTYTPTSPLSQPDEYYVYSFKAGGASGNGETAATLCSKRFFSYPPSDYFMGNLTSIPNTPLFATKGDKITPSKWLASGGSRPYIVLVFKDKKMILINIHAPHGVGPTGDIRFKKQSDPSSQHIKAVDEQNAKYKNIMEYAITELGIMLRKRIPTELKDYSIVFGGDFNCGPDRAQEYLAMLGENGKEGVFSNSSGQFKTLATNPSPSDKQKSPTCCVTKSESPGFTSAFDQIYSNKLNIVNYWAYRQSNLKKPNPPIGNLNYFSDHLPVYAEIQVPAPAFMPTSSPPVTTAATSPAKSKVVVTELSIEGIKTKIQNPQSSSIYIINGGSFNPPHFGHIGLFELAYQAIQKDTTILKNDGQKYYGVMVLAPEKHISDKLIKANGNTTGLLSLEARVKLCQLTINDYPWKDTSRFGPQNMIIISKDEGNPMQAIMEPFRPYQQIFYRLYYLCGSDFYFDRKDDKGQTIYGHFNAKMNMIYSIRESSLDNVQDPYTDKQYRRLKIVDSEYKEMSSSKIRAEILKMSTQFNNANANTIIANIGKGSYCYLGNIQYLIPKNNYGLKQMGCPGQGGGGNGIVGYTSKRTTLKNSKPKTRKIKKLALIPISTANVTKKQFNLKHSDHNHNHNKKHKTRRNKN